MFRNLGISTGALANVVSNENDVKAVVAKVALGEADAGVVYQTDVGPGEEQGQRHPGARRRRSPWRPTRSPWSGNTGKADAAGRFVTYVLSKQGQAWLKKFGFIVSPT